MKTWKVLLLILAFGLFSASAWADGDPTVKLSGGGGSPTTNDGVTATDPIFVTDGSHNDFILGNNSSVLYVEVIPYLGESFSFFASLGWTCEAVPPTSTGCDFITPQGTYANAVLQGFGNNVAQCSSWGDAGTLACPAVEIEFFGNFVAGEDIRIDVPEPSTMALLIAGLIALIALGLRKKPVLLT